MTLEDALIDWYKTNRRHLPWREDPTPYHVYLSETMLQQTQVAKVLPYYERFLETYPTIESLAKASLPDIQLLWQGLGYYSRAKNLLLGAKEIAASSSFPSTSEELLRIKGIGPYSEKAIRAIAFHQKAVAIDGNLIRVYARLNADKETNPNALKIKAETYLKRELHRQDPSAYNQALMDLGELICLPNGAPKCSLCPLSPFCKAEDLPNPESFPFKAKKAKRKNVPLAIFLFRKEDSLFLSKRKDDGLLAGLYEYPNIEKEMSLEEVISFLLTKGIRFKWIKPLPPKTHVFSHLLWKMSPYLIEGASFVPFSGEWIKKEDIGIKVALPTAFRKITLD